MLNEQKNPDFTCLRLATPDIFLGAVLVGLTIVTMATLSENAELAFHAIVFEYPDLKLLLPPIRLGLTAWLTVRFFPGSERSGIPQIKTALAMTDEFEKRKQLVSLRIAFGKLLLTLMALLSGASEGFGGPATHIGASIMLSLNRLVKFPDFHLEKLLLLAGSAAGFAAMFGTPLAGIFFALEEMHRQLEEKINSWVIAAIICSGVTAFILLNRAAYFDEKSLLMPWGQSWLAIPLCAVIGGCLGALFSKSIILGGRFFKHSGLPIVIIAILCGGLLAILGYLSNEATAGTGFRQTQDMLNNSSVFEPLYPLLKMLATCATFFSGISSGIFVPSLATGAGIGMDLAHWLPIAPVAVMVLLTMTAYFSGMLQCPMTSFVIVMEMTDSHEILLPLMASAWLASWTSRLINPLPLYDELCQSYAGLLNNTGKNREP